MRGAIEHRFGFLGDHETARDHLDFGDLAPALVDRDHRQEDSRLREIAPILHHGLSHDVVAGTGIDQRVADRHLVGEHPNSVRIELQHAPVLKHERIFQIACPDLHRQPAMLLQLPVVAVNRDKVARADQVQQQLEFLPARVSRHVQIAQRVPVMDPRAAPVELIDHAQDGLLVPGNHLGADRYGVVVFDHGRRVASQRRPREGR